MIDPDTIEDIDDCDGDAILAYGFDTASEKWAWAWLPIQFIAEAGRSDIIDRIFPRHDDDDDEAP
jgi:hypothetical protein